VQILRQFSNHMLLLLLVVLRWELGVFITVESACTDNSN
jgi:hypothetical protein